MALTLGGMACGPKTSNRGGGGEAGLIQAGTNSGEAGDDSNPGGDGGTTAAGGSGPVAGSTGRAGGAPLPDDDFPPATALHKLDLLLMVDNSYNTLQKQRLLMDAVGWLLAPPGGTTLPADDVHVGIITSSLGSHGALDAKDVCTSPEDNDRAHLLATMRPGVPSYKDSGFLAWGPDTGDSASLEELVAVLEPMLSTAGDTGCGYEASLEAWYRFLADPEPPAEVLVPQGATTAVLQGVDQAILEQRAAFLRPDSVVAIVVMSDENDCSIVDQGYGWLISRTSPMFRSTSVCHTNPNDPCCQSCGEQAANAGCNPPAADAECQTASGAFLDGNADEDDLNLRCWNQKGRFGFELLHPISRYTEALTRQYQRDRKGSPVENPLFVGGQRHPSQVIYTGIVGVPWQDLADAASLAGAGLTYLSAAELTQQKRWEMMIGDPDASPPVRPTDPFMIETPTDRAMLSSVSAHPLVPSARLVPSDSTDPQANVINGHESANLGNHVLQTACIFPLQTPKTCDQTALDSNQGCQCFDADLTFNRAQCQPPGGGAPTTTQYYDDAFPGIRHLQLLHSLGDSAIAASACPKVFDAASPDYGYRPAMNALAQRLELAFAP
ncbi:MAG TPA: hypothetical protein VJN18_24045 [Polyangiaceae bacterium]|nr:hypothetical protein [Polyangiaceae bacterium]